MIVVGGWPGRQVIGLNGRFGVRQSELASGSTEPNPFLNNFDPGDDALTEMVVAVTSLPASGTVTLGDDGDFTHTGAADGTYHTLGTVYSWAPGGPLVVHVEQEDITSTFGTAAITLAASATASGTATAALTTAIVLDAASVASGIATADLQTGAPVLTLAASATASGIATASLSMQLTGRLYPLAGLTQTFPLSGLRPS